MEATEQLLKSLTEANGVSGYEDEVRQIMKREMRSLVSKRVTLFSTGSVE